MNVEFSHLTEYKVELIRSLLDTEEYRAKKYINVPKNLVNWSAKELKLYQFKYERKSVGPLTMIF